ncbi:MAG: DNA cytosine methyltransferase [Christensenellales bacterium]|nr:DNA cytosine methyltransferase [Christensenellales bacterium]
MAEVSIFSFFAGCGILDLAFETTNYDIVFVNEFIAEFMNGYRYARQHLQIAEPL